LAGLVTVGAVAWALTDPRDRDKTAIDAAKNLVRVLFFTVYLFCSYERRLGWETASRMITFW
jgi:hypothetical protein